LNFSNNLGWKTHQNESCSPKKMFNFIVDHFLI
jgi:hypothetical protein